MGNKQSSTDALDPHDTYALHSDPHSSRQTPTVVVDPQHGLSATPGAAEASAKATVPSYFGLLSCSTVDVVPNQQHHNQRLLPGPGSTGGGAFDSPMTSATDVWLVAGQSNAIGENGGDGQEVPLLGQPLPDHMSVFLPDGRWTALSAPCTHAGVHHFQDARGVGPDVAFARTLLGLGCSTAVGLVPTAAGASDLHTQWAPGGPLYVYLIAQAKAAVAALPGARLRGVIWVQGEADAEAGHEADAATYGERLASFITHLRHDLSQYHPCLPVLLGVMAVRQRGYFQHIHTIRQHQLELEMPNVIKVDMAGYEFFEEYEAQLVHMTKNGVCAFGAALAHAYYAATHAPRVK